jgi:7,8-dihydropterin-6-yl-methyl-4-(beta-D-ribofuranosyl)aminobenzene 5'-phosphate synthase
VSACQGGGSFSRATNPISKADKTQQELDTDSETDPTSDSSPTSQPPTQPTTTLVVDDNREDVEEMITITVVFDNYPYQEGLETDWGFSAFITYQENNLLFDTGLNGSILLSNMNKLGIRPDKIQHLVLSHEHNDHTGGVLQLLSSGSSPSVYLLSSFPNSLKQQIRRFTDVIEVVPKYPIFDRISTTGEISGYPNEQALVIDTPDGLVVITGCSHPGVEIIVQNAKKQFREDVILVLGGFHLGGASESHIRQVIKEFKRLGVVQVAPSHCTGDQAIQLFREAYGEDYIRIGVGAVIEIDL